MQITDDMCERAIKAAQPDRIQGFATPTERNSLWTKWGPPYYVRDVHRPYGKQELWRGDDHDEMLRRCEIERMRLALSAALLAEPVTA